LNDSESADSGVSVSGSSERKTLFAATWNPPFLNNAARSQDTKISENENGMGSNYFVVYIL